MCVCVCGFMCVVKWEKKWPFKLETVCLNYAMPEAVIQRHYFASKLDPNRFLFLSTSLARSHSPFLVGTFRWHLFFLPWPVHFVSCFVVHIEQERIGTHFASICISLKWKTFRVAVRICVIRMANVPFGVLFCHSMFLTIFAALVDWNWPKKMPIESFKLQKFLPSSIFAWDQQKYISIGRRKYFWALLIESNRKVYSWCYNWNCHRRRCCISCCRCWRTEYKHLSKIFLIYNALSRFALTKILVGYIIDHN